MDLRWSKSLILEGEEGRQGRNGPFSLVHKLGSVKGLLLKKTGLCRKSDYMIVMILFSFKNRYIYQ